VRCARVIRLSSPNSGRITDHAVQNRMYKCCPVCRIFQNTIFFVRPKDMTTLQRAECSDISFSHVSQSTHEYMQRWPFPKLFFLIGWYILRITPNIKLWVSKTFIINFILILKFVTKKRTCNVRIT
jgi:hypothetical protein